MFGTYQVDEKLRPRRADACLLAETSTDLATVANGVFHINLEPKPELKLSASAVLPKDEDAYIRDDDELARRGGVKASDRVEVTPWIESEGRFSWVTNDPEARELKMFAGRRK